MWLSIINYAVMIGLALLTGVAVLLYIVGNNNKRVRGDERAMPIGLTHTPTTARREKSRKS